MSVLAFGFLLTLATLNGANDFPKTVATLLASSSVSPSAARWWALAWLLLGALAAMLVIGPMYATFAATLSPTGAVQVMAAVASWLLVATVAGWPVSTTHALLGAVLAEVWMFSGSESGVASAATIWRGFLLPLVVSPPLAFAAVLVLRRLRIGILGSVGTEAAKSPWSVKEGTGRTITKHGRENLKEPAEQPAHWWAVAAVSFARALQDAAKVAALGMVAFSGEPGPRWALFLATAAAMAAGAARASTRVERALVRRVSPSTQEAAMAGYVTATFVVSATLMGWPLSTTHVSVGAIAGSSVERKSWAWATQTFTVWALTPIGAAAAFLLTALASPAVPR